MAAIDVGGEAIDRGTSQGKDYTYIAKDNPANADGVITTVEIWAYQNITGLRVGTFYLISGTDYKCRDSEAIPGTITAGSKQTYAVSIIVKAGDLIGCYYTGGAIDWDTSGYAGGLAYSGEAIDPGDQATYTLLSGDCPSLKGVTPSGGSRGIIIG